MFNKFDKFEKDFFVRASKTNKRIQNVAILYGMIGLTFTGGVVWTAVHFIRKFW